MIILGLTGSIAMGKSTIARMFRQEGIAVHDADDAVHRLMSRGGAAVSVIIAKFGNILTEDGAIDREALGRAVFEDDEKRAALEAILHPLVREDRQAWLDQCRKSGAALVVLDIPLLYETGGEQDCDAVAVVSASPRQQKNRAMARPGMTAEKFAAILKAQLPDAEKRQRADYVIPACYGETASHWHVRRLIKKLKGNSHYA